MVRREAKIVLDNGTEFYGWSFGALKNVVYLIQGRVATSCLYLWKAKEYMSRHWWWQIIVSLFRIGMRKSH